MPHNLPKVQKSVVFIIFTELCNHHHDLFLKYLSSLQREGSCPLVATLHSPLPPVSTQASTNLCGFPEFAYPVLLCRCNLHNCMQIVWLTSFTLHKVFKVDSFVAQSIFYFFLLMNNILLNGYTTFCLSIQQLIYIWVISVISTLKSL